MQPSLVHNLKSSVNKYPDNVVLVHGDSSHTYGQLWAAINATSACLTDAGIKRGDRVALLLDNSIAYVVAYYAVLLAGGVVVALNASTKARDILNWIKHCGACCLVTSSRHVEFSQISTSAPAGLLILDTDTPTAEPVATGIRNIAEVITGAETVSHDVPLPVYAATETASIIYTSGTTGNPKGVTLSHHNLVANMSSIQAYLQLGAADRLLNVLPFYYSYGNSVLHTHLAVGGSLVLQNSLAYPHLILKQIQQTAATGFSGVPSTYALLLSRTKLAEFNLSSLRYMTQAGGPMPPNLIQEITTVLPKIKFFVMYGQTEATARLTYLPPDRLNEKLGSIGIPIPGVSIDIRDENEQSLGPDQPGEIYAKGDNIMQGYWNDQETTRSVLRNGWLKTGDLATRDKDGFLYIIGRQSDMIKSGAHRISPKEIEEAVMEVTGVAEVAVVGVKDELLGQVIKAVIVPRPDSKVTEMQIKAHCKDRLATYKIPKFVEFVQELPKTASGKVKRFLLS